jgi:type IV pilus assembly protein PilQ
MIPRAQCRPRISAALVVLTVGVALLARVAGASTQQSDQVVNLTLFETDLREALAEVSIQSGIPILVDSGVSGHATVDLVDATIERALKLLLAPYGYVFRLIDGYYIVGQPDSRGRLFGELADVRVVQLLNISASQARSLVPFAYEQYVKFDSERDIVLVAAPSDVMQRVLALLEMLDAPRRQIRVKALVTEVRSEVVREWGFDKLEWSFSASQALQPDWSAVLKLAPGTAGISIDTFGAISGEIRALERQDKAIVHADPSVLVADGGTGRMFVGERRNVVLNQDQTYARLERLDAGTELKVTPRLRGDVIELVISHSTSRFRDSRNAGGAVIATEVASTVRLKQGQTVLIAGLTSSDDLSEKTKTPILGDIPLVRLLFQQTGSKQAQSELLIFITAELVD